MIKEKDVITIRLPYPHIHSKLAINAHMYICWKKDELNAKFVKCQTLKPGMIGSSLFTHYVDEEADITRNPFAHATRIDCDKSFIIRSAHYDERLKTGSRPDVCQELFDDVLQQLIADGYLDIPMDVQEITELNHLITSAQILEQNVL